MEITIGTVVRSAAGHDRGDFLIVVRVEGDFAFICDGRRRPLSRPKKKRLKHLRPTNVTHDISGLTDKGLRELLKPY